MMLHWSLNSLQSVCEEDYHMAIYVNNHSLVILKGLSPLGLGYHLAFSLALECVVLLSSPPHMRPTCACAPYTYVTLLVCLS